jgi:hypothetical protein
MGSGAKSFMRKGFLIYEEMHPIPLNFLIFEENFTSFFISVHLSFLLCGKDTHEPFKIFAGKKFVLAASNMLSCDWL